MILKMRYLYRCLLLDV